MYIQKDGLTDFLLYPSLETGTGSCTGMAEEIITYVSEHFAENITIEHLADRAGLSLYYFIRAFKKETGFTPYEYILNIRIANARYLLKNSHMTIKDICLSTGFSCESAFCSAFKRRQGMTPTEYRGMEI